MEPRVLALLAGEPAGRIFTRNAGSVSFEATFGWRPGEKMPADPLLPEPPPGAGLFSLRRREDPSSATRTLSCEVRALHADTLAGALDAVLRSVTAHAALTGAVLETRAVRLADPAVPPVALVEELTLGLRGAGLPASFGPSWTPAPDATVSVGTARLEKAFEAFVEAHPAWRTPSSRT